jgi:hypothetical protein
LEKNTFQISEVSKLLGVRYYRIEYAHRTQALAEPPRVNNVRTYFAEDVRRVARHFGVAIPAAVRGRPEGDDGHGATAGTREGAEDGQ